MNTCVAEPTYNDVFYVASLIEYVSRATKNKHKDLASILGVDGFERQLSFACVNHCLSFEQVSSELIEEYGISAGEYDVISNCKWNIPHYRDIGAVYARLIEDVAQSSKVYAETLYEIFTSGICDVISNFNSAQFFAPRTEIAYIYQAEYAS